ncbi:hypothetical protein [Streptococcus marimammalium]|uniref:hypothetical protein n=1 Tax=Streptococcus marimammalium TaxID=269666 RepID=UPI000375AE45|nr:hypothetical protein [Streptococcus marimammalium]
MSTIKELFLSSLQKAGIPILNNMTYFFDTRPEFFPEGTSVYSDNNKFYLVGKERHLIIKEKEFESESDLLFDLLDSHIIYAASLFSSKKAGENLELYKELFKREQIRLFNLISSDYGRKKEIQIKEMEKSSPDINW